VGELDVAGALAAVDRLRDPRLALPDRTESWMTLGADVYLADGSTPLDTIIELRAPRAGSGTPPPADGFMGGRLAVYARVDGSAREPPSVRRVAPGVWRAAIQLPAGLGGSSLSVGATFDGADIVDPKSVPIATDIWNAEYPPSVKGGCAASGGRTGGGGLLVMGFSVAIAVARRTRRSVR
jgi:hypothetical protein